jgi:hypothetical protein
MQRKLSIESGHFLRANTNASASAAHQSQLHQQVFERVAPPPNEKPLDVNGMSPTDTAFFNDDE